MPASKTIPCLFALVAIAPSVFAQKPIEGWRLVDSATISESGATISMPGFAAGGWIPAVVPGTVLTSLVAAGRYPEPLYGLNNLEIPESLCRTSYWYRAEFMVPASDRGRHSWLRFDGVNYAAEVWVDGHRAGEVRGAFARGFFDITQWVHPGAKAAVAVKVSPPAHPGTPHEQSIARGTGPNGGVIGTDGPTFVSTIGWDWIPGIRDRDMGLWQPVVLTSSGDVTIHDPFVKADLPSLEQASLSVRTELRNESDTPQSGELRGSIGGTALSFRLPVKLAAHETKKALVPNLVLDHPKLWWPNGYGKQNLYHLQLQFVQRGKSSDSAATTFGVRKIAYFLPGSKGMTVQVNGVPIMCRGGNWGIDEAMKRSPIDRLDAQMRMHREANCTMIRNWVGQSTQEDFYAACDKYGILVWDDFWLANPVDGPNPADPALFLGNAKEKILRFRNHPSIAIWCGRNEGFPPAEIEKGLESMTAELDGTRFYQAHSSSTNGVSGGGPYGQVPFARYFNFSGYLHTEVGAPSIPTIESIEGMMPKQDWWPINDDWAYHDLTRGAQGGDRYLALLSQRYGPVSGLRDFARKGAMLTFETYREIFEGRNSKLFAPASGVMLWMSNPAQPSFVWQLYHHDLDPTAALYGTKLAGERIHVQTDPDGTTLMVNTTTSLLRNLRLVRTTFGEDGKKTGESVRIVNAAALAATSVGTDVPAPIARLRLYEGGRLLSENVYWGTLEGRDDVSFLDKLPNATLAGSMRVVSGGVVVTVRNSSSVPAILAHFSLRHSDGSRVLPAFASDNYITIFPGESRTIRIEAPVRNPRVFVDGWNVQVTGSGMELNGEARV